MDAIDRIALIVRPRRRCIDWVNSLAGSQGRVDLDAAGMNPSIYLVYGAPEDAENSTKVIDDYAIEIFEHELEIWSSDETDWPVNRTPHVFRDWFEVTISGAVWDADEDMPLSEEVDVAENEDEFVQECAWCRRALDEDEPVVSLTIARRPDAEQLEPGVVEVPLADRTIPMIVPTPESEAATQGVGASIMLCSEECATALQNAVNLERQAFSRDS